MATIIKIEIKRPSADSQVVLATVSYPAPQTGRMTSYLGQGNDTAALDDLRATLALNGYLMPIQYVLEDTEFTGEAPVRRAGE